MKKALCLVLTVLMALAGPWTAIATDAGNVNYTVAEKLLKQLWAGSGFSGTLQAELTAKDGSAQAGLVTKKPLNLNWDYIMVNADALTKAEQRLDVSLMDGETVQSAAHIQLIDRVANFQADLVGEEWLTVKLPEASGAAAAAEGTDATVDQTMSAGLVGAMERLGVPAAAVVLLPVLFNDGSQYESLKLTLDDYLTRMDLWLEGYRQSTVMGKLDNGTGTMALHYSIPVANVKAQLKQLLMSLLADNSLVARFEEQLGAKNVAPYLNITLQPYYFAVIDALPLQGELTIDRLLSLRGSTLSLRLALPYYDVNSGNMTISYERVLGADGLFTYTVAMESEERVIRLTCLEYSSMTDVMVYQGTFSNLPAEGGQAAAVTPVAVNYTLSSHRVEGQGDGEQDTCQYEAQLVLAPDRENGPEGMLDFEDIDMSLNALFTSKALKNAATEMNATLTVGGENRPRVLTLTLYGKTRKQWTPAPIPADRVALGDMTQQQIQELIGSVAINAVPMLLPYIDLTATPDETDAATATTQPAATPDAADPTATPGATNTATATPAPTPEPTATPVPTATVIPALTATPAPTATIHATSTPSPTVKPAATATAEPTASPAPTPTPTPKPTAVSPKT